MLLRISDHYSRTEPLRKTYRGVVVDNNDGRRLGRVRCRIEGLITADDVTALPWIYAKAPPGRGGRKDTTGLEVPELGSELTVEFLSGDIYAGFYTGYWRSSGTSSGAFGENYPHTYGNQDRQGTGYKVNTAKRIAEFFHASGARAQVKADGTTEVTSPTKIRLASEDGKTFLTLDMEAGTFSFAAKGKTDLGGDEVHFSSNKITSEVGSVKESVSGGFDSMVTGGFSRAVGGGASDSILSNYAKSVGGNVNELIAQALNQVIGLGLIRTIATVGIVDTILAGNHIETVTLGNYLLSVLAGTMNLTTGAGIMNLTSGAAMNLTAALLNELVAGAKTETVGAAKTETIGAAYSQTIGAAGSVQAAGAYNVQAGGLVGITAGAALNLIATAVAKLSGSLVQLGSAPTGAVLTTVTSPLVDLITGVPSIGCATVFAGP